MFKVNEYSSVKRWLNQVFADGVRSKATESLYLHFLRRYCKFASKNPDELIAERDEHLQSRNELVRRQHEDLLVNFRNHLEKEDGLARSSVVTASNVVKSFYVANYLRLEVRTPKSWPATKRKVPTPEELAKMIDAVSTDLARAIIICLAQSGLSLKDFLAVTYEMIKPELDRGVSPLHLNLRRSKVMKEFDTFLGENSIHFLKQYLKNVELKPKDPLFPVSKRFVEYLIKGSSLAAGLKPHVTPHKLRSFFNTYLVLSFHGSQSQHIPIVDYWMGHVLPYGGAYMVPPVEDQREIYRVHEHAISLPKGVKEKPQ